MVWRVNSVHLVKRKIIATLIFVCILERPLELIFVGLLSKRERKMALKILFEMLPLPAPPHPSAPLKENF